MPEQQVFTNKFSTAKWIVDANGLDQGATHTTIAGALSSAVSGETIFVRPGQYIEDLTLKSGVNITTFVGESDRPNVEVVGKMTATFAGIASVTGIRLTTNSDFLISVTGSAATLLRFTHCFLNVSNNDGIEMSSSDSGAQILIIRCISDIGAMGIKLAAMSSPGLLEFSGCGLINSGVSTTPSTCSAGRYSLIRSNQISPLTTSGTGAVILDLSRIALPGNISLIHNGSGLSSAIFSTFVSGSETAITIGASAEIEITSCVIESTNVEAISGTGSLIYSDISYRDNVTGTINVTSVSEQVSRLGEGISASHTIDSLSGDSFLQFQLVQSNKFRIGVDDDDLEKFKISQGSALGTNDTFSMTVDGERTLPLNPCFLATNTLTDSNVTGNGTDVSPVNFDLAVFDQNGDFASDTFTAPVTGRYLLSATIFMGGITGMTGGGMRIQTSNRNFSRDADFTGTANRSLSISVITDMDASDTAFVSIIVSGGAQVADVIGRNGIGGQEATFFSGNLIS